jgi:chromate transporter
LDVKALVLAALAAVALLRFKLGIIPVIAACAVAGLAVA